MTGQQLATLIFLLVMIVFSAWAYRESRDFHRKNAAAETSEKPKSGPQKTTRKPRKK
jgi:cbb3-type cytochrome oxidase subunit 3